MTPFTIKRFLSDKKIEYAYNERIPSELSALDLRDVFIIPRVRIVFDPFFRLEYTSISGLELNSYMVFQPKSMSELKEILNRYDISY